MEQAAVNSYIHQGELERELGEIPVVLPSPRVTTGNSFRGSLKCRAPAAAHGVASAITDAQIQLEMGWKIIKIIEDHQVQLFTCHCQGPLNTRQPGAICVLPA